MKRFIGKMMAGILVATTIFGTTAFAAEEKTITVLHTNDTHAAVNDDGKAQIGFAKFGAYVDNLKKDHHVLVVDAGDMFQGLPFANLEKGKSIVPIVNQVGYDAMTVGNHEFDFGAQNLKEIEKDLKFPMVSANIKQGGQLRFKPYVVKEVDGIKVGIFGLSTPETAYKTHPDNVKGYEFTDMVQAAKDTVAKLRNDEKVDVVIGLVHLGLNEGEYTSDLIAKQVEGIDLLVDGHSHTTLATGQKEGNTLIVSTGSGLKAVGKVELKLQDKKVVDKAASLLKYDSFADVTPKQGIVDSIKKVEDAQKAILDKVVGKTKVELVGTRGVVRTGESNLGQLATDAMLDLTKADIAITNGGGIRASIKAGDITMRDMVTVFPFGNTIMVKDIKGSDLVAALEHGTSEYPNEKGAFPHVGGMTFTLNVNAPAGHRVTDVKIKGEPADMDKMYSVATNDFMAVGGDGYDMFKAYVIKAEYNTLMDTLLDYVKKQDTVEGKLETRITFDKEAGGNQLVGLRETAIAKGYKVDYDGKAKVVTMTKDEASIVLNLKDNQFMVGKTAGKMVNMPTFENGHYKYMAQDLNAMFNIKAA